MNEPEVFIAAEKALTAVVDQIRDDQGDMKLPEWFQIGSGQDRGSLNLRKIVDYHAYDDAWVPDVLAGRTAEEVGDKYDGDLLGDAPKDRWHTIVDASIAAALALKPENLDKPVHLSYGDFPAREYLKHITSFRGFRAFDIAKMTGADTKLPDDLVQGMWDLIGPEAEQWRAMGVFGPKIEVADDAPLQDRLLGLAGRDPG